VAYNSAALTVGEKGCVVGFAVGPNGRIAKMPTC
jgi:hypothetical protein